ncbi:MAG TPA: FtsX-like permease family protein [Candidatus Avoscillospira stercorigallinarum]|uniref:FtsX-like permease family protein n=1 Tax=Candidatus Avoscillospira stercorigallinarum TaxID=2840708 RepID=A0A9D0Z880_9FIRM|nr:FtsX-like permease family protein [Candidatus Avoscillospira stercorigallinarum]
MLFLVLTLSFAFAVMMLSVMGSMNRTNIEYLKNTYGAWHGAIPDGKDSDRAFLERRDWLDRLGESVNYGQVRGTTPVSGVGSVDETFLELGRIRLDEGRLPEQPGEIAMEADLLVALGYEPAVRQTVSVPMMIPQAEDPTSFLLVVRDFVLTGVLHEYAHLWILENNVQNRLLNSALILPEDGEAILAEAQAMADEYQSGLVRPPLTSYFYTPLEGMEERLRAEVDAHMAETRGAAEDRRGCVNVSAGAAYAATDYNTFYVGLILVIALLAVVAVYLLELQSDVRRVVRLRSIGASKTQIRRLLLLETVLLAVPAVALGTALGAAGTVGLLRLLVFSGSVEIVVDIPWSAVAAALALWIFGVGLMRLLTFQLAVRTPMTGRMVLETKQRRRVHKLQRVFAWGLSMALCLVATYSILEYQLPWVLYTYYSGQHAYSVYRTESSPLFAAGEVPGVMTAEETELLLEIPGVTGQMGITCLSCRLRGETVEEQDAQVYVVDAAQWMERNGAPFFDGVDLDAYRRGELAVLVVAVQQDGTAYFTTEIQEKNAEGETVYSYETTEAEVTAAAGDTLELALAAVLREEADGGESMQAQTLQIPTVVGAVAEYGYGSEQNFGLPFGANDLYSVLVSPGYIQRVLDTLPEGSQLGPYWAGGLMGFEELYLFADANAEYLFTDNAVAQLARRYQLGIGIFRTMYAADIQGYLQTMLTLAGTGVCVGLIAALLLLSTLELEAQRERRRYGILRALGMSRRQQNLALARQAALQAVTAIAVSCGVYVIFGVRDAVLVYQRNEEAVPALLQLLVWQLENLRYTWFLPLLLLGEFLLVVALYFAAKGRLYKLNLMEMLSQER